MKKKFMSEERFGLLIALVVMLIILLIGAWGNAQCIIN